MGMEELGLGGHNGPGMEDFGEGEVGFGGSGVLNKGLKSGRGSGRGFWGINSVSGLSLRPLGPPRTDFGGSRIWGREKENPGGVKGRDEGRGD